MKNTHRIVGGFLALALFTFVGCAEEQPTGDVTGCLDPTSVNYNPNATIDDNSCVYISDKQNTLVLQLTSMNCPDCYTLNEGIKSARQGNNGKMTIINLHGSDSLSTQFNMLPYDSVRQAYNITGGPAARFILNDSLAGNNPTIIQAKVDQQYARQPVAGVGVKFTVGGGANFGKLNVNTYIQFFQPGDGKYFLGVYFLTTIEGKGQNNPLDYIWPYQHAYTCVGGVLGTSGFGVPVSSGPVAAGTIINTAFVEPYDLNIPGNRISAVAVLWKQEGGKYKYVNSVAN